MSTKGQSSRCADAPRCLSTNASAGLNLGSQHATVDTIENAEEGRGDPEDDRYEDTAAGSGVSANIQERERLWTSIGIVRPLAHQIIKSYPHIRSPTSAQKLFALAVGAGKEVFLKDDMGRGKTLALAVIAMDRALKCPSRTGVKIVIIVPTPYLAHQIYDHLLRLTPRSDDDSNGTPEALKSPPQPQLVPPLFTLLRPVASGAVTTTKSSQSLALPDTPIILSTAKDLTQYNLSSESLSELKYIFIDEPDTLLGPIPPRYYPPQLLPSHPLNRHPPPIVCVLNTLLNIRPGRKGEMDFNKRYDHVNTIWTSASMVKDFKRVVKTRGWIKRGNKVVDLDFTQSASEKAKELRDRLLAALPPEMRSMEGYAPQSAGGVEIDQPGRIGHYALLVDPTDGSIIPLVPGSMSLPQPQTLSSKSQSSAPLQQKKVISPYILESLALLHATSPPPPGRYALILPPEGISLSVLATELSKLGVPTLVLAPHLMQIGIDTSALSDLPADSDSEQAPGGTPILLAQRSSVPGLHLKDLHTIYLLDGLDVGGLSQKQRKSGGVRDRFGFYDLVAGRLGRLGTGPSPAPAHYRGEDLVDPHAKASTPIEEQSEESLAKRDGESNDPEQRVISLVLAGTEEEKRLGEIFLSSDEGADLSAESARKKKLSQWDLEGLYVALEKEMGTATT